MIRMADHVTMLRTNVIHAAACFYLLRMPNPSSIDSEVIFTSGLDSSNVHTRWLWRERSLLCTLLLSEPDVKLTPAF